MSEYQENSVKSNSGMKIALVLIALVAATMGFLWVKQKSALQECASANESLTKEMQDYSNMLAGYSEDISRDLKTDLKNMLETYDKLKAKDASKADSINAQKEKIQSLLEELNNNKRLSAAQLRRLKTENETLRNIMKGYVKQIDSLNTLNLKLHSEIEDKTLQLSETSAERDEYKNKAEEATQQVKKGSKLSAYNFHSTGLKMKLNNTADETNKAKNAVMVKSSFTIGENTIAKAGKRYVYMQVIDPSGKVLQSRASNTFSADEGTLSYSDKKEIDYSNAAIDVAIYYNNDSKEFDKGTYKVRIYCDGQMIGSDSFSLK